MSVSLGVDIAGLHLKNPIMTASGTCGYGKELEPFLDPAALGAVVVKGLSLEPRLGNPPQRIVETPSGLLNSIGLQNIGVEAFLRDRLPDLRASGVTVIANIFGYTLEEYAGVATALAGVDGIAALEINISCPNVTEGGIEIGTNPAQTTAFVRAVRDASTVPVIAKLTPNVTDIVTMANAAKDGGADAVTLINTLVGMTVNTETRRPHLGTVTGGLSGPAIRPVALAMVYKVATAVDIPIVGCGGVTCLDDVLQYLIAGASAVQVGTATYLEPDLCQRLVTDLADWCEARNITNLRDLIGTLKTGTDEA